MKAEIGYFIAMLIGSMPLSGIAVTAEPTMGDLEYARLGDRALKLDLYQSTVPASSPSPLVVWIHGGAWRAGSKDLVPVLHWRDCGFAIASLEYRLSPEARFPAQMHDIKAAIRYLRANADRFHIDPDKFIIAGASAGGHLAALTGVSSGVSELEGTHGEHLHESSAVQAIVSFYGASNLQSILSQSTEHGLSVRVPALQLLLGGLPEEVPGVAKLASPVTHVEANDPSLWLIHGDADPQMPPQQSVELKKAYERANRPVKLDVVPGGEHGGEQFYSPERLDRIAGEVLASFD